VQWQIAVTGNPAVKAMAPSVTSADLYRAPWHSPGGALSLDSMLGWATLMSANALQRGLPTGDGDPADMVELGAAMADGTTLTSRTPVAAQPIVAKYLPWIVETGMGHPDRDKIWEWRDESDWPLPDTQYKPYYLEGDGPTNTASGRLVDREPTVDFADTYLYDPRRPVPSLGGTLMKISEYDGAADQRPVQGRDDVLCFTTGVLEEAVEVTGPVSATLFVSSSAVDTDFTAKLVDIHPDGRAIILCDGIQRMRYRDSLAKPELMEPGEIYEISIDLIATSNVFLPGHEILLEISSSNFPRYDRNSNTGGVITQEHLADMVTA
jgi:predicted acyl esterase